MSIRPPAAGTIVPLRQTPGGNAMDLVERIRSIRAAGAVPLVGDERWSGPFWERLVRRATDARPPQGTAWATLTSGSTGAPRIVCRSADSWSASFPALSSLLGCRPGDVIALPAPLASSMSLFSVAHYLEGGPRPVFGTGQAITETDFSEATLFHGTPHALGLLLDAGTPARLRTALVGGSALDPALRSQAARQDIRVISYYGAAELSLVAVDAGDGLAGFPGVEVRVDDDVLWVRSTFVADGYLEPTPDTSTTPGPLRSADGWHTVGDRACWENGRLSLLGRADGAILTASATVIPEDVEATLRSQPGVRDAVVLGLPHPAVGSLLAAVIEPDSRGAAPTSTQLRRSTRQALAPAHRPRRWFTTELPRSSTGKPARAELARSVAAGEVLPLA